MQIQYNYFLTNVLNESTELHGIDIFQGKNAHKKKSLEMRVNLFKDIKTFLVNNKISIRVVKIDVYEHRKKYTYPEPEYNLGLMLALERFCDYLDKHNDIGLVFGDYEKDEVRKSILDFSQFKHSGTTPMYYGRPLGRLMDTIYFTQSHHSRFLQVADLIIYMAGRYGNGYVPTKWHDLEVKSFWEEIVSKCDIKIQKWPK